MEKLIRNITIIEQKAREIRIANGLTQKEFGDLLGISKSDVSDIENGYIGLSVEHINKICNFANVSFDYMFDFKCENNDIIKLEEINPKIVGENIKIIRKDLKYTQEKLANKLHIVRSLLAHYEVGRRLIKTEDLKQLCEVSDYSADWIVGKSKNKFIK